MTNEKKGRYWDGEAEIPLEVVDLLKSKVFGWNWEDGGLDEESATFFWNRQKNFHEMPRHYHAAAVGYHIDKHCDGANLDIIFPALDVLTTADIEGNIGINFSFLDLLDFLLIASTNLDKEEQENNDDVERILEKLQLIAQRVIESSPLKNDEEKLNQATATFQYNLGKGEERITVGGNSPQGKTQLEWKNSLLDDAVNVVSATKGITVNPIQFVLIDYSDQRD